MDWQLDELIRQIAELNCRLKQATLGSLLPTGPVAAIPPATGHGSTIPAPRNGFLSPSSQLGPPTYPLPVTAGGAIQYDETPPMRFNSFTTVAGVSREIVPADPERNYLYFAWGGTATVGNRMPTALGPLAGWITATTLGHFYNIRDHMPLVTSAWYIRTAAASVVSTIEVW